MPFLKFITNNQLENIVINENLVKKEKFNKYKEVLYNIDSKIGQILEDNNITLTKIYENTIIKNKTYFENEESNGLYIYSGYKVEKELIQLYVYLTGNFPIAQNILICNKQTLNEEIMAFFYRAIFCDDNSCFIIGGIESLNFNQKTFFIEKLKQIIYENNDTIKSCLIILSIKKDTDIFKELNSIKYKKTFNSEIENKLKNITINKLDNITIVSSKHSGLGKSTKIENLIKNNKKEYFYFPIGGVFTREDIIQRLKNLKLKEKSAIHLDLYDTDYIDILSEFLFWLLITKLYKVNDEIFCLLKDTEIYVEIPNGFINFYEKFSILSLLSKNDKNILSIENLEPLIISKEIGSNVQIVCNYLKQLKDNVIDVKDLVFAGITQDDLQKEEINAKTFIEAQPLSQNECQNLIFDIFKDNNFTYYTYYQVKSLIDILAVQFKKFNQNYYLNAAEIGKFKNLRSVRTFTIQSIIKFSHYFTQGAFTKLIYEQKETSNLLFGVYNEIEDIINANNKLSNEQHFIISYDKIDTSLIFFHEGEQQSFSVITNKNPDDEEYKNFLLLYQCQKTRNEDITKLNDYKKYEQIDFLKEMKNILGINNCKDKSINKQYKSLEEIAYNYAFTADNFIKMILILIRINSNIPVIMMGETGCGKTALIRKLAELKNYGSHKKMKILNIHAGTTDKDIITFIEKINKEIEEEKINMEEKIWIFLDEINTCKSMGLISELMCKHSYHGHKLSPNLVFISACNPYRKIKTKIKEKKNGIEIQLAYKNTDKINEKEKIKIEKLSNLDLVYKVNPLPHSLLNYVFDFGSIGKEDEKKYIDIMIKQSIEKIFNECKEKLSEEELTKIKNITKNMIIESQNFLREFNDISSVSLREIRRYTVFYEFFYNYLKNKKEKLLHLIENKMKEGKIKFEYDKLTEFDLQIYSINLSIFICYYLRIQDKEKRKELVERLNKIFTYRDFLELPLLEEHFIVDNIELPKGTAKNKALLENLFSLFCSINVKIPIFIVGKPGCSKSLSVQLIYKSMKGKSSKNELFKLYPSLVLFSYQGSLSSTSESVENIFVKARSPLQRFKEEKEYISMIFFDEMGLAENSPNNPLKVIHSELEYDLDENDNNNYDNKDDNNDDIKDKKRVAFVGISNWVLDASKMNRGLHISIPELDEEDAINTALTIAKSYNEDLPGIFNEFFKNLGKTYYKYKEYLKRRHCNDGKEDFHGNRDFYHFVKYTAKLLSKKINIADENELIFIGLKSIERNFAGLEFGHNETSVEVVQKYFLEYYPNYENNQKYNSIENIRNNKKDDNSRYLLLISKSIETCYLLSSILEDSFYNIIIGSKFKEDIKSEEYQLKIIKTIQFYMEKGKTLILKDIESVYPALYDLFNQNFTSMNGKNFARISIGSSFSTYSDVDDNFKCIVDVNIDEIKKQEPPFLNRFEKHILKIENLLGEKLTNISNIIKGIVDKLISNSQDYKNINYDISKILINCDLEQIQALVYKVYNDKDNEQLKDNEKEIINQILSKIALTLPQDIIIPLKYNNNIEYKDIIIEKYLIGEHSNLQNFLNKLENKFNIIYTFSEISENIEILKKIENKALKLEINNSANIKMIKIREIKSERELDINIDDYLIEEKYQICIIQFTPEESQLINYTKFFIENKQKEYSIEKVFIFIVHIARIFNSELKELKNQKVQEKTKKKFLKETISNLSNYYQIFIDNLNGDDSINKILKAENDKKSDLIEFTQKLEDYFELSMKYFKYNISFFIGDLNKKNYLKNLLKFIKSNEKTKKLINEHVDHSFLKDKEFSIGNLLLMGQEEENEDNPNIISEDDIDMISAIKNYFNKAYIRQLNQFIYIMEENSIFPSLLLINQEESELKYKQEKEKILFNNKKNIIKKINLFLFETILKEEQIIKINEKMYSNIVNIILGIKIPGIKNSIKNISNKINEEIINNFKINEFTKFSKKDNDNYMKEIRRCCNLTSVIIKKEDFISKIIIKFDDNELSLFYDIFIDDYYI